jgi:RNA polymerase sigma-70 factor (ECF subfamily)
MEGLELSKEIGNLHRVLHALSKRFTTDHDESLDLVQDTILRALMYKDKFRQNTNLKGWLFTIMRNTFINQYRKNKLSRTLRATSRELASLNPEEHHTFNKPAENYEYQEVWKKIHSLNDDLLIPFEMHACGYKYHEIAAHQNIPLGTVKNRIFHARQKIKKELAVPEKLYKAH